MKRQQLASVFCAGIFSLGLSFTADAALVSVLGGQGVYDTDLDITWLANASAGVGSIYDDGISTTDGKMSWASANSWAASLTVAGVTGWRLPTTLDMDATCDSPTGSTGFHCTGSELGHLFYNELSGIAGSSVLASGDPDLGLFTGIEAAYYWSGTVTTLNPLNAWDFLLSTGLQNGGNQETDFLSAWAVHSGNVSAVPIPAAAWLFGSGLLGLIGIAQRKNA